MGRYPQQRDRGLANGILYYFATLAVTILLWIALNSPFATIMDYNRATCATQACTTGTGWLQQGWDNIFWMVFIIMMLSLITWAIYESRRPGL